MAATVSLTVAGPLPLWLPVLLAPGLLLLTLIVLLGLLSPGLPLLILICGRCVLLLLLLLLFLLAHGLLLFLFGRLGCFLFRRFVLLLVLFGFCALVLLSECRSKDSEQDGQSPYAHKPDHFHTSFLHCHDFLGYSLFTSRVVVVSCDCRL
ncbi:MAG: hypothetical protein WCC14_20245 [Acidobacteriaceae bacterium]